MDAKQSGVFLGAPFMDNGTVRSGWTVGGGWEYAFSGNWSVKLEYDYYDFGNKATTACFLVGCVPSGVNDRIATHSALIGVNYKFGAGVP
jgi:outer membrane immunogenic protein